MPTVQKITGNAYSFENNWKLIATPTILKITGS